MVRQATAKIIFLRIMDDLTFDNQKMVLTWLEPKWGKVGSNILPACLAFFDTMFREDRHDTTPLFKKMAS